MEDEFHLRDLIVSCTLAVSCSNWLKQLVGLLNFSCLITVNKEGPRAHLDKCLNESTNIQCFLLLPGVVCYIVFLGKVTVTMTSFTLFNHSELPFSHLYNVDLKEKLSKVSHTKLGDVNGKHSSASIQFHYFYYTVTLL